MALLSQRKPLKIKMLEDIFASLFEGKNPKEAELQ